MSKLEANVNIKDFEEFKISYDIFHKMLNDENINVGIRLKYIHEFNNKIEKENNMNIPYVKVNNQKEFERVVAKMERETGLKLNGYLADIYTVVGLNHIHSKITTWNEKFISDKIISADEYLTGTRENFTLGDLEDGMVVELRDCDENLFFIFNKTLIGMSNFNIFKNYSLDLTNKYNKLDIIKVYKPKKISSMRNILNRNNLTLIFDAEAHRNKSKISQRKSEIENEMAKLQEELKSLEVK